MNTTLEHLPPVLLQRCRKRLQAGASASAAKMPDYLDYRTSRSFA